MDISNAGERQTPSRRGHALAAALSSIIMLFACFVSDAIAGRMLSEVEMKALPPYCAARYEYKSAQYQYWQNQLGQGFQHVHHLCDGYGLLNRYFKTVKQQDRNELLRRAYGEINYVVQRVEPNFSLLPEMLYNRARVLGYQNKPGEALTDLRKAIELNPRLVPAYTQAADLLINLKKPAEALTLVTDGLRNNPDMPSLQKLYDKLGGVKPYPEASVKTELPASNAAEKHEVQQPASSAESTPPIHGGTSEQYKAAPIGMPDNPWCRFCPITTKPANATPGNQP